MRDKPHGWCPGGHHALRYVGRQRALFGEPTKRVYDNYGCTKPGCDYEVYRPAGEEEANAATTDSN